MVTDHTDPLVTLLDRQGQPFPGASGYNPPPDTVPSSRRLAWGVGGFAERLTNESVSALTLPIYNVGLGVNAIWIGWALALPRLLDAITDPLMGHLSDNARTRWGRRRPFIFIGAILTGLLAILLWNPWLQLPKSGLFLWYLIGSILCYLAYTIFVVPFSALGIELTADYDERTRVQAWRMFFFLVGGLAGPWFYKLCFVFGGEAMEGGVAPEVIGAGWVGLVVGGIIIVSGVCPAIFCRERLQAPGVAEDAPPRLSFFRALASSLRNRSFCILLGGSLLIWMGLFLTGPFLIYINLYYTADGLREYSTTINGWVGTVISVVGMFLGVPLSTWLSTRIGKRPAMISGLVVSAAAYVSQWWTITPAMPYLQLVSMFALGLSLSCCWLLIPSMVADVCDEDELVSGLRREGLYSAVSAFSQKAAIGFATLLSGYLLHATGYLPGPTQTPETIWLMRVFYVGIQAGGLLLGALAFFFYPLTHARAEEVRRLIDQRNTNS